MKKTEILAGKSTANKLLWDNNSPFKQKIVESKKRYKRKDKHSKKYEEKICQQ